MTAGFPPIVLCSTNTVSGDIFASNSARVWARVGDTLTEKSQSPGVCAPEKITEWMESGPGSRAYSIRFVLESYVICHPYSELVKRCGVTTPGCFCGVGCGVREIPKIIRASTVAEIMADIYGFMCVRIARFVIVGTKGNSREASSQEKRGPLPDFVDGTIPTDSLTELVV